jgi:hypothetical protein
MLRVRNLLGSVLKPIPENAYRQIAWKTMQTRVNIRLREVRETGSLSRHRDWLKAGQPTGRNSSPCRVKIFLLSMSFRSARAQPGSYSMGTGSSFPAGKGTEA